MTKQRLIDANEAIGIAKEYYWVFERSRANLTDLREVLKDCTTIEAKPVVHAHWISKNDHGYEWVFVCSNCGYVDGYPFNDRHNYCPNCGAKMDGGIENG